MNKLLSIGLVLLLFYFVYWMFDDSCRLSGCDREAIGWKYYTTHQKGVFGGCIGACKMSSNGGYCSKEHAIKGR